MKNILNYKFGFYLLIVVLIGIFVADSIEEDDNDEITKAQVKETISNFFSSIEIGSELDTYDYITEDFQLVELGGPYTLAEFWSLIESSQGDNIPVSRNWDLSNWTISIDDESAHVNYKNNQPYGTSYAIRVRYSCRYLLITFQS